MLIEGTRESASYGEGNRPRASSRRGNAGRTRITYSTLAATSQMRNAHRFGHSQLPPPLRLSALSSLSLYACLIPCYSRHSSRLDLNLSHSSLLLFSFSLPLPGHAPYSTHALSCSFSVMGGAARFSRTSKEVHGVFFARSSSHTNPLSTPLSISLSLLSLCLSVSLLLLLSTFYLLLFPAL